MGGPWEKYAATAQEGGPWLKYAAPAAPEGSALSGDQIARIQAAKAGTLQVSPEAAAKQQQIDQPFQDQMAIAASGGGTKVAAREFTRGVPFLGQYADELYGALHGDAARQEYLAGLAAFDRQNPKTAAGLGIAGGVAGSIPAAVAAGPAVVASAPGPLLARVAAGAGAGAAFGGLEGAVSGFGAGDNGNRGESALKGGVVGATFGGALGGAAPAAAQGLSSVLQWAKGKDISIISDTFGISKKAAGVLKTDLEALDFGAAARNLKTSGADAMVADAGQPLREALDAAITGGGKAARIGTDAVSARAAATGTRLGKVMDTILGAPQGIKSAAKSIAERTAPMRKKAYDMAYGSAIDYASTEGRNIEATLQRIPSQTLSAAVSEANDAMQAAGIKNMQIMAQIGKDGSVAFREMPNVQQLDEIKKALGAVASKEVDQFGRPTAAGIRARALASDLKSAISDAVPGYKTAVKLGGDKIAEDQALDMGRKLFLPGTTRETVRQTMKGASLEAQDAARRGIREYIDDTLARVRRSIDDPSADTQETRRLLDTLTTRDARDKLTAVLGPQKAGRLFTEIDAAGKQFATRQAVATGSATGRREARSRALDNALAPGIIGNASKGELWPTIHSVVQMVTRATPANELAARQAVLADVAKALTTKRGPDAQAALTIVQKAIEGQPVKTDEAARLAQLLASSGALVGYQSQQLIPRGSGTAR